MTPLITSSKSDLIFLELGSKIKTISCAKLLTDDDELDPDGVRAESVDALADEDAGVVLVCVLDLKVALGRLVPLPREVDLQAWCVV